MEYQQHENDSLLLTIKMTFSRNRHNEKSVHIDCWPNLFRKVAKYTFHIVHSNNNTFTL